MKCQTNLSYLVPFGILLILAGCGAEPTGEPFSNPAGSGGSGAVGGVGGAAGAGGESGFGGEVGAGGTSGLGGTAGSSGTIGHGGATGTGGMTGTGGNAGTAGTGTGGSGAAGVGGECQLIQCDGRVTLCGNCLDDDGDGLIDNADPECLGPCDNYEGEELLSGVGGETGEQCKADCYFDFGNGAGNDDCTWSRSCDPLEPKVQCTYDVDLVGGKDCPDEQSQLCEDVCATLTPNGCDCFGCCTFPELAGRPLEQGGEYVYIGSESGCTFDTVTDPASCQPCTPVQGNCLNTCERCELCLGKTELPPDCFPGTGGTGGMAGTGGTGGSGDLRCDPGVQACGLPGDPPCPAGGFCLTGCCILVQ
jgi:hypothetical protein